MSKSIDQVLTGYFDDITSSKINSNELEDIFELVISSKYPVRD